MFNKKGFTLIEILISIVFLGFLLIAVLEAEASSIHQNYSTVYNLYSRQILSYELSYMHSWANEGNVNWSSSSSQIVSCANFGQDTHTVYSQTTYNCLSSTKINSILNTNTSNTVPIPSNIGIFLYITNSSSCQVNVYAYVLWTFQASGGVDLSLSQENPPVYNLIKNELSVVHDNSDISTLNSYNNEIFGGEQLTKLNCS
jgi:prepilin-type N-terminal cleavage/methylation domain-containing protein